MRAFNKILLCLALVVGLVGISAPVEAATSRTLTATYSTKTPLTKGIVTVKGSITKSAKGTTVTIQRKYGSTWKTFKSTKTTTSAGAYSTTLTMPSTRGGYYFRAYVAKKGSTLKAAASAATKISVRSLQKVTVSGKSEVASNSPGLTLTGSVAPFKSGATVTLQGNTVSATGTFATIKTAKLTSKGKFTFTTSAPTQKYFRVTSPVQSSSYLAAGTSSVKTVKSISPATINPAVPDSQTNLSYSTKLTTAQGRPGTWKKSGTWPSWLSVSAAGQLTGTAPGSPGSVNISVTFTDTALPTLVTTTALDQIDILAPAPPVITSTTLGTARVGEPFNGMATLNVSNPPGSWSVSPALPPGLTLNTTSGAVTGTPTAAAVTYPSTTNHTLSFTGATPQAVSIQILAARPVISATSPLTAGTVGNAYSKSLTTTGNKVGTWTLSAGDALPNGLSLNTSNGAITGTPTAGTNGTYNLIAGFTETATTETAIPKNLTLTVAQAAAPVISTTGLPGGVQGTPYSGATLTVTGNPPGTWSITSGALPGGLTLAPATGEITGTPTGAGTSTSTFKFTQTSTTLTASKALSITITGIPPAITTNSLPVTSPGSNYSVQLTKTGGSGTWTKSGTLPSGVSMNPAGLISGTPGAKGTFSATFTFTSTNGLADSRALILEVRDYINSTSLPAGSVGVPYSAQLQKNGNIVGTWSYTGSGLPGGLSLDPITGTVQGTPTNAGTTGFHYFNFDPTPVGYPTESTPTDFDITIEGAMPAGPAVTKVSAGNQYACKIKQAGTLWCWGYNFKGQLGIGQVSGSNTKFPTPTQVGSASNWRSVATGAFYHTCAIQTDNSLWCMGYNNAGQLGNGSNSESSTPQRVGVLNTWESVSVGTAHTCAVKTDHTMWCWGAAAAIGLGPNGNALTPQQVGAGTDWASVSAGASDHTCGLKTTGELWCWGSNYRGQLGDGTTTNRLTPVQIGSSTWKSVSGGNGHTCAIQLVGDTLWCWGINGQGQVGNGTSGSDVLAPVQIGSSTWKAVSAGGSSSAGHTCGIKTTGSAWCWGYGASGQLGNGTVVDQDEPTQVDTTLTWSSISAGGTTTCGVKNDETQRCWGDGGNGEMGNGQLTPSPFHNTLPVSVIS